jgi:hypothetical protein
LEQVKRGRDDPDALIERYLVACERNKLRKARRIYRSLDPAGQHLTSAVASSVSTSPDESSESPARRRRKTRVEPS